MKKIKYIVALFVIAISMNSNVFGYFNIKNYDINAKVINNGDLYVEEKIEYATSEERNGVYREIDISNPNNKLNSADDFILNSVSVDKTEYKIAQYADNGQEGVFQYFQDNKQFSIKVFAPFKNTGRVVEYKYLLKNVAVKYNDVGEIYWNFIGSKWQDEIKNLNIKIELPGDMRQDEVYVFGHGSDNGTFNKLQNNIILLTAKNIIPGQQVDARIVFPSTVVSESEKIVNKDMLGKIISKETSREKTDKVKTMFIGVFEKNKDKVAIGSIIITILIIIYAIDKDKKIKIDKLKYFRDIPDNLEPAILGRIYSGVSNGRHFWATFFDLIRKKIYRIDKTMDEKNKEQYIVKYIGNDSNIELKNFEEKTIKYINESMGDNKEIEFKQLNIEITNIMAISENFRIWEEDLDTSTTEVISKTSEKKESNGIKLLATFNLLLILIIIFVYTLFSKDPSTIPFVIISYIISTVVYTALIQSTKRSENIVFNIFTVMHFTMFQLIIYSIEKNSQVEIMHIPYLVGFIALNYILKKNELSAKENEIIMKLKALRNYIKDFSLLNEKDIEYINLWQQYLVMAIMFGLPKKILKRICENLDTYGSETLDSSSGLIRDYAVFSSINSNFGTGSVRWRFI